MSKPDKILVDKALGLKNELGKFTLNHKNFILYALGIGFSTGFTTLTQIHTRKKISNSPMNITTASHVDC